MASTSGSYDFNYNRDQIIASSLRKLGAIASGETPSASMVTDGSDQLNIIVKMWNATGLHIWTETEATLFVEPKQKAYTLGGSTPDHCTTSYTATTLSTAAANGATSVVVTSIDTTATGDNVGIVLDDGTLFWTTVSSVAGNTILLNATLTDTSAVLNPVYHYPVANAIIRPLRVMSCRRYHFSGAIETPMTPMMARLDYRELPNKDATGVPTRAFYDPRGGANTQGIIYIWPVPTDTTDAINMTWWRPLQDFDSSSNIPDLPTEWLNALIWNLAYQWAPEFDCAPQRFTMIEKMAAGSLDLAMDFDREPESYLFGYNADQTGP